MSIHKDFKYGASPQFKKVATLFIIVMGAIMVFATAQTAAALPPPSALPEQCANGAMNEYPDCRQTGNHGWKNSQVNSLNGQYYEGVFIPYRQTLEDLIPSQTYCFGIAWDISQGGLPAIDYLASYTEGPATADPTYQTIHDGTLPDDTIAIPTDPVPTTSYYLVPADVFTGTMPATRELTAWGATFVSAGPYSNPGNNDISLAANEENSMEYCIQAIDVDVVIAFTGHVARAREWQAPGVPGGSPYHLANGTKGGLFTAPRTSETDLACGTCTPAVNQNIGRNETQLQLADPPPPTAIQLRRVSANATDLSPLVWIAAILILSVLAFITLGFKAKSDQVS